MGVDIDLVIQGYKLTCAAPSWADAASVAATRALRLVVSVRSVTPRGVPVLAALVGGGVGVGTGGEGMPGGLGVAAWRLGPM